MFLLCYNQTRGILNTRYTIANKVGKLTSNRAAERTATSLPDTDRWRGRMKRRWRDADYLRKQAASEEVGQPVTLTGDSYTDLRRDGG